MTACTHPIRTLNSSDTPRTPAIPYITLLLAAVAGLLFLWPGSHLVDLLVYDRQAFAEPRWYRLLTCHFTHWSLDHLLWDVVVFVVLGCICELRLRQQFLLSLGVSALAIPLAVHFLEPALQNYRGLSGLDSTLFGLLAMSLLLDKIASRQWLSTAAVAALILAFAAKVGVEYATGTAVFVNADEVFVPVPLAHLVGAGIGIAVACIDPQQSSSPAASSAVSRVALWPVPMLLQYPPAQ